MTIRALKNIFLLLGFGAIFFFIGTLAVLAAVSDIKYPVPELNNCGSEAQCKAFCADSKNMAACLNFAEKNNLMSRDEVAKARKFLELGGKGPGGCGSKDSCENYCNDVAHIDECVAFAEQNGMMSREELNEAKQIQAALKKGAKLPGGCTGKQSCEAYCEDPRNMKECITFAEAAGFMSKEELGEAKKALQAIEKGIKPPACRGKADCDKYCADPKNMKGCIEFAIAAGFMSENEAKEVQKVMQALEKGIAPPKCRGKDECDKYCAEPDHTEECVNFAVAAGFMSPEDAERTRKTGGRGPGGCRTEKECNDFCNNPVNSTACCQFGLDTGTIPADGLQRMKEGVAELQKGLNGATPEVLKCLTQSIGSEQIEKIRRGDPFCSGNDFGDKYGKCFASLKNFNREGGNEDGGDFDGHGQIPSADEVMKMLPEGLAPEVLSCVRAGLNEDVIRQGEGGVYKLVNDCTVSAQGGGNVFQSVKSFFLKIFKRNN